MKHTAVRKKAPVENSAIINNVLALAKEGEERLLIDTRGAARLTGMSPGFYRKQRHLGRGPEFVRLGKVVRYLPSSLLAWVKENTVSPQTDVPTRTDTSIGSTTLSRGQR